MQSLEDLQAWCHVIHPISLHNLRDIQAFSISTIYSMSGRVVSDIQAPAEGERLYI